jgi:ribulose-5-phosphate 4-epimerase/fuculose-1-phosphate aldolase
LTVGPSVADAFLSMFLLERACRIQIMAQSGGAKLVPINEKIFAQIPAQEAVVTQGGGGRLVWPGLLRKLDRMGANFRD